MAISSAWKKLHRLDALAPTNGEAVQAATKPQLAPFTRYHREMDGPAEPLLLGRYELHSELASGGMAVVHLGRLRGDAGFSRAVAIKRLHRQYVGDPELTTLLLDEARLASRLRHPNIVAPRDLIVSGKEIFVVMEYIQGLTLAALVRKARAKGEPIPIAIVARIMSDVLTGLHAAHEAKDDQGRPLALVHRDVSPQNVMVGVDGLARVLDFGIAQAAFRSQTTRDGQLRAKLAYASPEHVLDQSVDRRADVYSAAIVCWELLTLERLFTASNDSALLARVLEQAPHPPSKMRAEIPMAIDELVLAALDKDPSRRPPSAEEFAIALEKVAVPATHRDVARWVNSLGGESLDQLAAQLAEVERGAATPETRKNFATDVRTQTTGTVAQTRDALSPAARKRRAWPATLAPLAICLAFATIGFLPWLRAGIAQRAASAATAALATAAPERGGVQPHLDAPDPPPVPPEATGEPRAEAEVTTGAAPALPKPVDKKRAFVPTAHLAAKPRSPASDDCADLTELGPDGIRRVKRQCLR